MRARNSSGKNGKPLSVSFSETLKVRLGSSVPSSAPLDRRVSPEGAADDNPLRAFGDVRPIPGAPRVPLPGPSRLGRPVALSRPSTACVAEGFVLERDEDHVEAYRAGVGPRVLRSLRSREWLPQETLDLHRQRTSAVRRTLLPELRELSRRGVTRVLILVGKGLHSEGGRGVLSDVVVDLLTDAGAEGLVKGLVTAPRRLGGCGALAVELFSVRSSTR